MFHTVRVSTVLIRFVGTDFEHENVRELGLQIVKAVLTLHVRAQVVHGEGWMIPCLFDFLLITVTDSSVI